MFLDPPEQSDSLFARGRVSREVHVLNDHTDRLASDRLERLIGVGGQDAAQVVDLEEELKGEGRPKTNTEALDLIDKIDEEVRAMVDILDKYEDEEDDK